MSLFADRLVTIPFAAIVSVTKYSLVGVPNPVRNLVLPIVTFVPAAEAVICLAVVVKFGVQEPDADKLWVCAPPASNCISATLVYAYVFAPAINEYTPSALYTTAELVAVTPTLPSVSLMFFNVTLFDASAADTFPALVTSNA